MYWLLNPILCRRIIQARESLTDVQHATAWEATHTQSELDMLAALNARAQAGPKRKGAESNSQLPRGMTIAGSIAELRIEGVLTKKPDFYAMFFGGGNTTYTSIRAALGLAQQDTRIKTVVLRIDSPGGSVDGLFETMDALATFRASGKKLTVVAENAQSAAYGLAAAAGPIEAPGRGATFGSIGTAASFYVSDHVVTLTNTDSPDKRPDVTTPEGKAVIVRYLDQLNKEFVKGIATGRGVDPEVVTDTYGRGASMTAPEAKRLGMIDRIASTAPRAPQQKEKAMAGDQTDDRAASAEEISAAEARGVAAERDRVGGHLAMGESCGDMSIALEAIRSGAAMTQTLQARYMGAGMNRADRGTRQAESNQAAAALAGVAAATPAAGAPDLGDQIVAKLKGAEKSFVHE